MHEILARSRFDTDIRNFGPAIAARLRILVNNAVYPRWDLTVEHTRPLRLVLTAPEWDEKPPSIGLCKADGSPMKDGLPGGIFNSGAHPATGLPFVCMPGSREFHTHPSHLNETWESFRGTPGKTLTGIAMQLADAWRTGVR